MNFIPYGKQLIDQNDIDTVVETLQSDFLTTGPKIKEFEEALDMGFDEFLEEEAWNLIEWPDLIVRLLPQEYVEIEINKITQIFPKELQIIPKRE